MVRSTVFVIVLLLAASCTSSATTIEQASEEPEVEQVEQSVTTEPAVEGSDDDDTTIPPTTSVDGGDTQPPEDAGELEPTGESAVAYFDPATGTVSLPEGRQCAVAGALHGVDVYWAKLPPNASVAVIADGQILVEDFAGPEGVFLAAGVFDPREFELRVTTEDGEGIVACGTSQPLTELPAFECFVELRDGLPWIGTTEPVLPTTFFRDGESFDSSSPLDRVDFAAEPGATYEYSARAEDPTGRFPAREVSCGSVTIPEVAGRDGRIRQAKNLFDAAALGAHGYLTLTTTDGQPQDYYLSYQGDGSQGSFGLTFTPLQPDLVGPYAAHDVVLAALENGSDVTYEIDPTFGILTAWTIDGVGETITCFELDTAPPELRQGPGCNPSVDLIGR